MAERVQICTVIVDGQRYGVPVERVQELLRAQPMTRVPGAPSCIEGLINLRGQIVTAIDLRRRLLLPSTSQRAPMNLVVSTDDGAVSLLVDAVGDVIHVDRDAIEPAPPTLSAYARQLTPHAYQLEDELLLLLDVDLAITPNP